MLRFADACRPHLIHAASQWLRWLLRGRVRAAAPHLNRWRMQRRFEVVVGAPGRRRPCSVHARRLLLLARQLEVLDARLKATPRLGSRTPRVQCAMHGGRAWRTRNIAVLATSGPRTTVELSGSESRRVTATTAAAARLSLQWRDGRCEIVRRRRRVSSRWRRARRGLEQCGCISRWQPRARVGSICRWPEAWRGRPWSECTRRPHRCENRRHSTCHGPLGWGSCGCSHHTRGVRGPTLRLVNWRDV